MSSFTGELTITETRIASGIWRLEQEIHYYVDFLGSDKLVVVPAGFLTDGASVPRFLWSVFPCWGSYSRASVVHDYLVYRINKGNAHPLAPTRVDADRIFLQAMEVCCTRWLPRHILYFGVRLGAYFSLRKNVVDEVNS